MSVSGSVSICAHVPESVIMAMSVSVFMPKDVTVSISVAVAAVYRSVNQI